MRGVYPLYSVRLLLKLNKQQQKNYVLYTTCKIDGGYDSIKISAKLGAIAFIYRAWIANCVCFNCPSITSLLRDQTYFNVIKLDETFCNCLTPCWTASFATLSAWCFGLCFKSIVEVGKKWINRIDTCCSSIAIKSMYLGNQWPGAVHRNTFIAFIINRTVCTNAAWWASRGAFIRLWRNRWCQWWATITAG